LQCRKAARSCYPLTPFRISAKEARHGRYYIFQMAEVAVPRKLFQEILRLIDALRPRLAPA